ncbi:hypothetical protein H4R18_005802 [Coemansia javaensis]|uniref:Conserved oligomeric Golgi complex subunit 2 n=1 Tax=Coemansia javaensis TaxID=2761396 RepID=A0A9W8H7Z9_9FUNG|nr:hypothetical protein H4R18_005802 [Coemansia javaensis]
MAFDLEAYAAQSLEQGKGLEDVHLELSGQLRDIRHELRGLINHRYEDFLGLSTSLTGVDGAVAAVRAPVAAVRAEIEAVRDDLAQRLARVEERLRYRAAIRAKKQQLRLFIDLSRLLARVDAVLGEAGAAAGRGEERAEWLERAAADLAQIRYFVAKGGGHPFARQAADHMRRIEAALLDALGRSLARGLAAHAAGADSAAAAALVAQCLRAYSAVDEAGRAEDVVRSELARPLVARALGALGGRGVGMDPGAFAAALQRILADVARVAVPLAAGVEAHFPAGGHALAARVFWREAAAAIMRDLPLLFVPGVPDRFHRNYLAACRFMREFAALFTPAGGPAAPAAPAELLAAEPSYAEFNRKWQLDAYFTIRKQQIVGALVEGPGAAAAAVPPASGSGSTPTGSGSTAPSSPDPNDDVAQVQRESGLHTELAARAVWAVGRCWAPAVYLEPLAARFWQLTVQILVWYRHAAGRALQQLARGGDLAPESAGFDEALRHVHDAFVVRALADDQTRAAGCLLPEAEAEPGGSGFRGAMVAAMQDAVAQTWAPLGADADGAVDRLAAAIAAASCAALAGQLRRATAQFRHTSREPPAAPSPFVAALFAPLAAAEQRVDGLRRSDDAAGFARATKARLRAAVCADVTLELARACGEALAAISKTEASLLRLRQSRAGAAAAVAGRGGSAPDALPVPAGLDLRGTVPATDNDKIRRQIWLDVGAAARIVGELGAQPHREFADFAQLIAPLGA